MSRKYALVTGGGKRIGAVLVKRCAEMGFSVIIHCHQSGSDAQMLLKSLPGDGHRVTFCDLSDKRAREQWLPTLPPITLLINNASVYRLTPRGGVETPENRKRYREINYLAPLELIQHQLLNAPEGAAAINLLDCAILSADGGLPEAIEPAEGVDSYLYSRLLLACKSCELARKYATQVRINAIAPGPVLPPVECTTPGMTKVLEMVPRHQPVSPEEIANAMEFLWRNPSMVGTILPVDGGMHLATPGFY